VDVWRRVRAYNPWPVATTTVDGEPLRILEAWSVDADADAPPGTVVRLPEGVAAPAGAGFAVRCGKRLLAVVRAQRAGKRAVTGAELLRGWRDLLGRRLG
jgi:methionyl-tRNA formyltransferase